MLIEGPGWTSGPPELDTLCVTAIIAGLLHDIKRREEDHAVRGSIEAEKILTTLGVDAQPLLYRLCDQES